MPFNTLKQLILPKNGQFFDIMQKQAETANYAAKELAILMSDYVLLPESAAKIREFEHQGDALMRELYLALNTSFIVPIDHSDISMLAGSLDDVLDRIDQTATFFALYKITSPTQPMVKMTEVIAKQTHELVGAVSSIKSAKTYGKAAAHCNEIKKLENEADELYNAALGELFESKDAIEIIKQKDALECLEHAADRVDKAAQIISDIVMKHA
ncbi:MAG: DUF47 family protein [Candidatus Micrarchaeota archaeon]